jgi:hypothetical protein
MIDYEKLKTELNQYALYILNSLNRDYGAYFNDKKKKKLNNMIKNGNLVEIDTLVDDTKIHINPNHEIFKTEDYEQIKKYFANNFLVNALLNLFITLSIPDKEYKKLEEPNANQSCCITIRKGMSSYITHEFIKRNRLSMPKDNNEQNLDFILWLQTTYPFFLTNVRSYAFLEDYVYLRDKFNEQTGEDLLDVCKYYKDLKNGLAIELLEDFEICGSRGM